VYGLIFLFRYALDENKQEASCPDHVWFANQTHDFSCATVSLLNLVNNIPNVDLGEHLQSFKDFSQGLTPDQRGNSIGNFESSSRSSTSFARKMDMWNIDLGMQNAYSDRKTKKKAAPAKKGKVVTEDDYENDENAFHFVAYMPIRDEIWKLDGLDRQPSKVGKFQGDNWLSIAVPRISERIQSLASGGIEFNLLSLVRDPLLNHQAELAVNVKCLQSVEGRLNEVNPSWKEFANDGSNEERSRQRSVIYGADEQCGLTDSLINSSAIPAPVITQLKADCPSKLMALRQELMTSQAGLRRAILDEQSQAVDDRRRATERRCEYGPIVHTWLAKLADKEGAVKELLEAQR